MLAEFRRGRFFDGEKAVVEALIHDGTGDNADDDAVVIFLFFPLVVVVFALVFALAVVLAFVTLPFGSPFKKLAYKGGSINVLSREYLFNIFDVGFGAYRSP